MRYALIEIDLATWLSPEACAAVKRARDRAVSYGVRILAAPGDDRRVLVVVGETHAKFREASEIGKQLVDAFELRGVETFPSKRVVGGRVLRLLVDGPRALIRWLSFLLESVSRIPLALHAASLYLLVLFPVMYASLLVLPLQAWVPYGLVDALVQIIFLFACHLPALGLALLLQRQSWGWIVHPAIAILTVRNVMMAEGTMSMLTKHPVPEQRSSSWVAGICRAISASSSKNTALRASIDALGAQLLLALAERDEPHCAQRCAPAVCPTETADGGHEAPPAVGRSRGRRRAQFRSGPEPAELQKHDTGALEHNHLCATAARTVRARRRPRLR